MLLADTSLVPNDGMTAGSGTTPRTVPAVRQAAAAVRRLLADHAAKKWNVDADQITIADGRSTHKASNQSLSFADLIKDEELDAAVCRSSRRRTFALPPTADWSTMGKPQAAPAARDKVTGKHQYPSDMTLPGMLYGCVLRSPDVSRQAEVGRSGPGAGDGRRDRGPRRRIRRRCRSDVVPGRQGDRRDCRRRPSGRTRPIRRAASFTITCAKTPACRRIPFADAVAAAPEVAEANLPRGLRAARPAGAARGAGRVGRQQGDGLDRHAEPVRRARRTAAGVQLGRRAMCA